MHEAGSSHYNSMCSRGRACRRGFGREAHFQYWPAAAAGAAAVAACAAVLAFTALLTSALLALIIGALSACLAFCSSLRFEDKPDYSFLRRMFRDLFAKEGEWRLGSCPTSAAGPGDAAGMHWGWLLLLAGCSAVGALLHHYCWCGGRGAWGWDRRQVPASCHMSRACLVLGSTTQTVVNPSCLTSASCCCCCCCRLELGLRV